MTAGGRPTDRFTVFLVVACVALAALVVLLSVQNRSLKEQLSRAGAAGPGLGKGDEVASFAVAGADGRADTVIFDGSGPRTLVLVFTSTCPHCERTLPVWREVLASSRPGLRVVGLQLDASTEGGASLATPGLPFPVYAPGTPDPDFLRRIPGVPTALLLRPDGTVEKAWYGAPGDRERRELEEAVRG